MPNEPIEYLDRVLAEEELRCRMEEYGQDRRKYSISRSGRYKSINKKRDALKPELFKGSDTDKMGRQTGSKESGTSYPVRQATNQQQTNRSREMEGKYTKFYETNL